MESVACLTKNALTGQFGYPLFAAKQVAATINELESSHFEWTINWKGAGGSEDFRQAVTLARQQGQKEREYRLWLRHPLRGRRTPTGKGHGGGPRFRYGRR